MLLEPSCWREKKALLTGKNTPVRREKEGSRHSRDDLICYRRFDAEKGSKPGKEEGGGRAVGCDQGGGGGKKTHPSGTTILLPLIRGAEGRRLSILREEDEPRGKRF